MLGNNSTQFLVLKMNLGLRDHNNFKSDSHGVGKGGSGVRGPPRDPERVYDESTDIRHVGYQFYSIFSTENEYKVKIYLRFQIRLPWGSPGASRGQGAPLRGLQRT